MLAFAAYSFAHMLEIHIFFQPTMAFLASSLVFAFFVYVMYCCYILIHALRVDADHAVSGKIEAFAPKFGLILFSNGFLAKRLA